MVGRTPQMVMAAAGGVFVGFTFAATIHAQPKPRTDIPGVAQDVLLNAPLAQCPGKVVTVFTGEFEPGAATPFHRHPGTEILFVLEGNGEMHIQGRASQSLTPGRVVMVEPDDGRDAFVHKAANLSTTKKMKTLVMVIHDAGTPPAMPVAKQS